MRKHLILILFTACATTGEPGDGVDDAFLSGGIADGTPEALGVLRVANELTRVQLDGEVGLAGNAAAAIDVARRGADGIANTADDRAFARLAELDAVKYVGPAAFGHLLAYARDHGYVVESGWPEDPWVVDRSCEEITLPQLAVKFGQGDTTAMLGPAIVRGRVRDRCNDVTGCPPWREPATVKLYEDPDRSLHALPQAMAVIGTVVGSEIAISVEGDAPDVPSARIRTSIVALPSGTIPNVGTGDQFGMILPDAMYAMYFTPGFSNREAHAYWTKRICSDGRFHFVTALASELGWGNTEGNNLAQVAIYGRLW